MTYEEQIELGCGEGPPRPSILALDLSLTACGWCLNGDSGVIATRQRGWERIAEITQAIFCKTFGVDVCCVEGYAFGAKGQAVYQLAELGGIVRFWLYQHHLSVVEVTPSTLKKFATDRGNANKDQVLAAAIRQFYFKGDNNNAADAHIMWAMAREAYGGPIAKVPASRAAFVHRLPWPRPIPKRQSA